VAQAFYNCLTNSADADSAGTAVEKWSPKAKTVHEVELDIGIANPFVKAMREKGIDIADAPRRQLNSDMLTNYDFIVNMAERYQTPDWLRGANVIWWDLLDPAREMHAAEDIRDESARKLRDEIESRVTKLIEVLQVGGDFRALDDDIDKEDNHA
jgi:protein-tyrosine-phosphatase